MLVTDHLKSFVDDRRGYRWESSERYPGSYLLSSGDWKGTKWEHDVVVLNPANRQVQNPSDGLTDNNQQQREFTIESGPEPSAAKSDLGSRGSRNDVAILYVTGGDPNGPDLAEAQEIANRSAVPVAMLFNIPNQPLLDRWEDDLIAHTFEQYIETGDATWPVLFPMVRAVIRTMDMLEEVGYTRFVVTGASKRGWSTWLAGATSDPRIIGIAPMVIDNLNFPAQMAHQVESWGGYSEQIEDYTSRELQDEMNTLRGTELVTMMDPINYIEKIHCPILIINGANDRYWTVDALSLYWDRLPNTTRCLIVPNAGHLLGNKRMMIQTLSAFAAACSDGRVLPNLRAKSTATECLVGAKIVTTTPPVASHLWAAFSENLDFRDSSWLVHMHRRLIPEPLDWDRIPVQGASDPPAGSDEWLIEAGLVLNSEGGQEDAVFFATERPCDARSVASRPEGEQGKNIALMAEAVFDGPTGRFSLSTPVKVFPAPQ